MKVREKILYDKMSDSKLLLLSQPPLASVQSSIQPSSIRVTQTAIPSRSPRRTPRPRSPSPIPNTNHYTPPSPRQVVSAILPASMGSSNITIDEANLDDELSKLGFTVTDKVLIIDDDNNVLAQYLQVESDFGQTALIELDTTGFVSAEPQDPIFESVDIEDASLAPFEDYGIQEPLIAGVSYQCDNGVCVRVAGGETRSFLQSRATKNYSDYQQHQQHQKQGCVLGESSVGHPVVKLSKVRENPKEVRDHVKSATKKIRTKDFTKLQARLVNTDKNLGSLHNQYRNFVTKQSSAITALSQSIRQLEGFQQVYLSKPTLSPSEKEKYERVVFELRKRYQKLDELLSLDKKFAKLDKVVAETLEGITEVNKYLDHEYSGLQYVTK